MNVSKMGLIGKAPIKKQKVYKPKFVKPKKKAKK